MKKRLLSLLLALLTVLTVIPVMSMATFASEGSQPELQGSSEFAPAKGNYSNYTGLWYDDGHLMSFVDMTGLTGKVTTADGLDTDAVLVQGGTAKEDYNANSEGNHWYIKILGGALAGGYYALSGVREDNQGISEPIKLGDDGRIDFTSRTVNLSKIGVYVSHAFDKTEIASATTVNGVAPDSYLKIDSTESGAYSFEVVAVNTGVAFDTYANKQLIGNGAYMNLSEEGTITGIGLAVVDTNQIALRDGSLLVNSSSAAIKNARPVLTSTANVSKNSGFHYLLTNTYTEVTESDTGTDGATASYPNTPKMLVNGALVRTSDVLRGDEGKFSSLKTYSGYVNTAEGLKAASATRAEYLNFTDYSESKIAAMNISTSQMLDLYFLRTYNVKLTDAQLRRNHFADICYYYGLDTAIIKTYNLALDGANVLNDNVVSSVFDIFAKADVGTLTEDDVDRLNAVLADPENADTINNTWGFSYTEDATYAKYKELYYDNGHLKMFFDLTDLNAAGNTVKLADNPTEEQIMGAKLLWGSAVASNASGQHYFVKSMGGEYAGYFFMLAADSRTIADPDPSSSALSPDAKPGKIEVRYDGLLNVYAPFHVYSTTPAGIYIGYAFSASKVQTSFGGISSLGATAPITTSVAESSGEVNYLGNYGHVSIDMTASVGGSGLKDGETGYVQYDLNGDGVPDNDYRGRHYNMFMIRIGGKALGSVQTDTSNNVQAISAGSNASSLEGCSLAFSSYDRQHTTPAGQALTLNVDVKHVDTQGTVLPDMRGVLHNSVARAHKGTVHTHSTSSREKTNINLSGLNPYYVRVYDCSLTNLQMLQNHFADLCYYYELDGIEELLSYGSYGLSETFLQGFTNVNIGVSDAKTIAQSKIDAQLTALAQMDRSAVTKLVKEKYGIVYRSALAVNKVASDIIDIVSQIDIKVNEANNMQVDASAAEIINASKNRLMAIKNNVLLYKAQVDKIKAGNDKRLDDIADISASIVNPATLDTYLSTATDEQLLKLLIVLDSLADTYSLDGAQTFDKEGDVVTVAAAESTYRASLANIASADVASIYSYMLSATVMTKISVENYIKFAFLQTRVFDHAGMRAVFTVDDAAIANGFVDGQKSYKVAAYGFITAYAIDDIGDIEVEYNSDDGKATSTALGAKIIVSERNGEKIAINSRYAVTDDARAQAVSKTGVNGSVYAIRNDMHNTAYSELKEAYRQKYMYRAFVVFEGEGTSFVSYADVYSRTLASSSISLYDVASATALQVTDERYLLPELYISKVIFRATGAVPTKED